MKLNDHRGLEKFGLHFGDCYLYTDIGAAGILCHY